MSRLASMPSCSRTVAEAAHSVGAKTGHMTSYLEARGSIADKAIVGWGNLAVAAGCRRRGVCRGPDGCAARVRADCDLLPGSAQLHGAIVQHIGEAPLGIAVQRCILPAKQVQASVSVMGLGPQEVHEIAAVRTADYMA